MKAVPPHLPLRGSLVIPDHLTAAVRLEKCTV